MNVQAFMARLRAGGIITALAVFLAVLAGLLHGVFVPGQTLFSNDGPLGQLMAQCHRLPDRFTGCWQDLNNVGFDGGAAAPGISLLLQWLLGPVLFSKFYALLALLILGLGAWCFLRASKLSPLAAVLGGLAAMLNSTFFSVACWGVGAHDITAGMAFFALAALANTTSPRRWLRVVLAGMAVGMAVTEGADVGALFSLLVAAWMLYQMGTGEGPAAQRIGGGLGRLVLVVICAAFLAAQSIHGLMTTSINGVSGTGQDAATKRQHWDWATQWSLPKLEALNVVVPGLFGYRMDSPHGLGYWGAIGRDPAWDTYLDNGSQGPPPTGMFRFSGGGNYAGGLVVLLAIWAAAQALRRKQSVFTLPERKWLWFWTAVAGLALLLALGRFAPFYQFVYALPYFSTIRNPTKFLYWFSFALVVLFGYGVDGLYRRHLQPSGANPSRWPGLASWWDRAGKFDRNWVYGCALVWAASLLGWWIYAQHHEQMVEYLQSVHVGKSAEMVANHSLHQVGWWVVVFFLAAALLGLIFSGAFAGLGAVRGGAGLALLLVLDLGLANQPWIVYWNYPEKYASNVIIDQLRDKPYEHRVAAVPLEATSPLAAYSQVYRLAWQQHQFPYYNIQSFETVEMSRIPADFSAFIAALDNTTNSGLSAWFLLARGWQLTATREILGPMGLNDFLSQQPNAPMDSLTIKTGYKLVRKPGITVATGPDQVMPVADDSGPFALFDFKLALPRAKLYSQWQVNSNDPAVLATLFSPAFDPAQRVLVAGGVPPSAADAGDEADGVVQIVSYAPKAIALTATAGKPSVLLLNDHFDPGWKVWVDGRRETLLRCNFFMRGVYLPASSHQIEFKFQPPTGWLYVSVAAMGTALFCLGLWAVLLWRMPPVPAAVPTVETIVPAAPTKAARPPGARTSTPSATRVAKR